MSFILFNRLFTLVAILGVFVSTAAHSAVDELALAAYERGAYDEALARIDEIGGADNYALGARALNAVAYFEDERKVARKTAKRAFAYAEKALEEDEDNVEATLQAAISLGVRGANMSPAKALMLRLPGRSKKLIDVAGGLDPENQWVLSTAGAWKMEVARRGAARFFGVTAEEGFKEMMAARTTAPDNVAIAYEAALRMLALSRDDDAPATWRDAGIAALDVAVNADPTSAFEEALQSLANGLKSAVDAGADAEKAFLKKHL